MLCSNSAAQAVHNSSTRRAVCSRSLFSDQRACTLEPKDAQPQKHPQNLWFWEEHGLVGGLNPTPLKNDGVKVSWDYELPNIWGKKNMFQTTNQQGVAPLQVPKGSDWDFWDILVLQRVSKHCFSSVNTLATGQHWAGGKINPTMAKDVSGS